MSFEPFNKTAEQETIKALDASYDGLRRLSPKSGAYINEVRLSISAYHIAFG